MSLSFPILCAFLSIVTISLLPSFTNAVMADDEIFLPSFNRSFWLKNETYTFQLIPAFNVPLQVLRHTIYTASTSTVISVGKRAIMKNYEDLYEVSPEDYEHLHNIMDGDVPEVVRVNFKKRSLEPLREDGTRVIRLSPKITVEFGTTFCLHIPFVTTCDNQPDLTAVKSALQDAVDEIHTEIDSYTTTNNARMEALTNALNSQRAVIEDMFAQAQQFLYVVGSVARSVQVNAAQIADGDFQIHSQINYLKRVTNSLLKFSNALASTDPRAVVAQPSLSRLFSGFIDTIAYLNSTNYIPILDSRVFTWQETILPTQSMNNITSNNCSTCALPQPQAGMMFISTVARIAAFTAVISINCSVPPNNYPQMPVCITPAIATPNTQNWIYGPFHKDHYGIYSVSVPMSSKNSTMSYTMQPVISSSSSSVSIAVGVSPRTAVNCVQFLGYTMLASFSSTSLMVNGVLVGAASPTDCDALRLIEATPELTTSIYSLYAESEGVIIPFYSNCDVNPLVEDLTNLLGSSIPDTVPTINYVCTNAWSSGNPSNCGTGSSFSPSIISGVDVYLRHWVSPNCYINLEPGWLELDYYVNPPLAVIPDIPRGYDMNQFTINPEGELASSLEFVYTNAWVNTYVIQRISSNTMITDEISLLENSPVLFYITKDYVIDESDSFYGEGNNGRDCIRQQETYDYDLTGCFFQNDNTLQPTNQYRSGLNPTTGIARYVDKFYFSLNIEDDVITFTLVPQENVDFVFSIDYDGNICPQLNNIQSLTSGCTISLFYLGNNPVTLVGSNPKSVITVTFKNHTANMNINFDTWTVQTLNPLGNCFLLVCQYTTEFSVVRLVTPDYNLISASDQALEATVSFSVDNTISNTISTMNDVLEAANQASSNISALRERLAGLNFNVTALFPYEDVAEMRKKLQSLIDQINTNSAPPPTESGCQGFWGSPSCWSLSFFATIIAVGVLIGCVSIGYFVCIKMGLAKKILGKKEVKEKKTQMTVYNAD